MNQIKKVLCVALCAAMILSFAGCGGQDKDVYKRQGLGCGVPAVQASRTIENDRDRKMTIMTTTFIPCSARCV